MINKENIKRKILKLKNTGFFSIFIATIMSKVFTVLGGIILVRVLSKSEYGKYAYIYNCFSMLFLLSDFGISSAALQYFTENENNSKEQVRILRYSVKCCLITSIATGLIIFLSPYFYPYTIEEAKEITPLLFLVPIITIMSGLLSVVLRANFENKKYSKLQIFSTFITYFFLIVFALIWGVKGAIISQYFYSGIILVYSVVLSYKYICKIREKNKIEGMSKNEKKKFIKYALTYQLNNTISSLLLIIDTFLIGYMIPDVEIVASYNVGSKLPHALAFLPTCIAIYIVPHFVKHNKEPQWLNRNFNLLIKYSFLGFGILCITLIVLSKPIFAVLFGKQYYDTIPIYIILIIGLFFTSTFKYTCSNILGTLRKLNINIITNICCIVINFISNIFFIKWLGIIGAAITTTATNIINSLVYFIYLKKYLRHMEEKNDTEQERV